MDERDIKHYVARSIEFISLYHPGSKIFADTSAIIYCAKVELLNILVNNYDLMVAHAILEELYLDQMERYPETKVIMETLGRLKSQSSGFAGSKFDKTNMPNKNTYNDNLHKGERALIDYYQIYGEGFVLTDDKELMRYCKNMKYPFTSTIIIPSLLFYYGLLTLSQAQKAVHAIFDVGFFSQDILNIACTVLGSMERKETT